MDSVLKFAGENTAPLKTEVATSPESRLKAAGRAEARRKLKLAPHRLHPLGWPGRAMGN